MSTAPVSSFVVAHFWQAFPWLRSIGNMGLYISDSAQSWLFMKGREVFCILHGNQKTFPHAETVKF